MFNLGILKFCFELNFSEAFLFSFPTWGILLKIASRWLVGNNVSGVRKRSLGREMHLEVIDIWVVIESTDN